MSLLHEKNIQKRSRFMNGKEVYMKKIQKISTIITVILVLIIAILLYQDKIPMFLSITITLGTVIFNNIFSIIEAYQKQKKKSVIYLVIYNLIVLSVIIYINFITFHLK